MPDLDLRCCFPVVGSKAAVGRTDDSPVHEVPLPQPVIEVTTRCLDPAPDPEGVQNAAHRSEIHRFRPPRLDPGQPGLGDAGSTGQLPLGPADEMPRLANDPCHLEGEERRREIETALERHAQRIAEST